MMNRRLEQILIAFDQLVNACFGGWADETLGHFEARHRRAFLWQKKTLPDGIREREGAAASAAGIAGLIFYT